MRNFKLRVILWQGEGPFPGVLDLFGTVGGIVEHRSALLASRGIASLALCYIGLNDRNDPIDMEYFEVRHSGSNACDTRKFANMYNEIILLHPVLWQMQS